MTSRAEYIPSASFGRTIEWNEQPACAGTDPEIFYAEGNSREAQEEIRRAKKVCAQCPVNVKCLEAALVNKEVYGVWGGLTPQERLRASRRSLGRSALTQIVEQATRYA